MCQARVYKILKKNKGKWMTTLEIAKKVNIGKNSLNLNLRRLYKQGLIEKIENTSWVIPNNYRIK